MAFEGVCQYGFSNVYMADNSVVQIQQGFFSWSGNFQVSKILYSFVIDFHLMISRKKTSIKPIELYLIFRESDIIVF